MTDAGPTHAIPAEERLIYALDGMTLSEAVAAVRALQDVVRVFKIGPPLVYQGGLDAAHQLARAGHEGAARIFLDMKSWDIPDTVLRVLDSVEQYGGGAVAFATLHTYGLSFQALREARARYSFQLLAVTLLTSQDASNLQELGIGMSVEDYVLYMARRAQDFGCDGVIASPLEAARIKAELGPDFRVVTPGVRPATFDTSGDDQKRFATPRQAILNGADYLVVGRPIRSAPDPLAAAAAIQQEIREALAERDAASPA